MNELKLFKLLLCYFSGLVFILKFTLSANLDNTSATNMNESKLETGPCQVVKERDCEKLCFNGTCQLNVAIILSNSTKRNRRMNLKNVMPVFKLAERDTRFEGLLPNEISINWHQYDDNSTSSLATISTIYGYSEKCAHVFFGPTFDYPLASAARIVKYLGYAGTPLLTVGGLSYDFQDTKNSCANDYYMTIKVGMTSSREISRFFLQIVKRFRWNKIFLMFEPNGQQEIAGMHTCYLMMKSLMNDLKIEPNIQTDFIDIEVEMKKSDIKDILAKHIGVVYPVTVMCVELETVRKVMLSAHELNMTSSGEYIFFNIILDNNNNKAELHPWIGNNETISNNEKIRDAYSALMTIKGQSPPSDHFVDFSKRLRDMSQSDNQSNSESDANKSNEEISPFVAAFYDAFLLYVYAINETLSEDREDWNYTIIKGSEIVKRMYSRNFQGVTGNISINSNGDRINTYILWTLNPHTNLYEESIQFYNNSMQLIENRTIYWADGKQIPPASDIKCGFDNSKCPDTSIQSTTVVCIILTCVVVLLIIMSIVTYRYYKFEIDIASMTWKIHWDSVDFISDRETKRKGSSCSFINYGSQGEKLSMLADKQLFAPIGVYKGHKVAIKRIEKTKIELNRSLMVELKWMKDLENDHLVKFYGACLEPSTVYLITEYASRGSLQDVIENEKIEIDQMFRTSLMHDIARGMCYLHCSEIKSHGSLKSSNCLVDSRFVLKISDFGLQELRQSSNEESIESESFWRKKLWTAPELLRMDHPPAKGTQKGDVYSFGIIIHEIEIQQGPFYLKNDDRTAKQIVESVRLQSPASPTPLRPHIEENVEDEVAKLMKSCWSEDAADRPDFPALKDAIRKLNKDNESGNLLDNLLSRMEQYANNLEALVDERTSDFLDQKRKCEELLYQLLPKSVASQLILGQPVIAESYDQVTICFSDIVGFTSLSAESTPLQVVDFLNDLFTCFDSIIESFDVYKIETIGDAYMVVSGLPVRNKTLHAREIGRVCLALMKAVHSFKIRHKPTHQLRLRMGIHTGPCVAGVVGLKMPRYCLFGDTVNTASRMESSGEAMRIHVSSATKAVLDTFGTFLLELRGQIEVKGKGKMSTYWLNGEKQTKNALQSSTPVNIQQNIVTGKLANNRINTTVTIQVGTSEQSNTFSNSPKK